MKVVRNVYGKLVTVGAVAAMLGGCGLRSEVPSGSIKDGPVAAGGAPPARVAGVVYSRPHAGKATVARRAAAEPASAPKAAAVSEPIRSAEAPPHATASVQPVEPKAADRARLTKSEQDARTVSLQLLAEGQRLFALGKVMEARKRYFAAMDGPVPEVLLALARSFDTHYLSRLQGPDGAPDMTRALNLYERAVERGSAEAAADIARIRAGTPQPAPEQPPRQ